MKVEDPTNAVEVLTLPSSPRKRDPALGPRFRRDDGTTAHPDGWVDLGTYAYSPAAATLAENALPPALPAARRRVK
jgi:hypothetical protein